jgi:acetyl esterase/lipase
MSEFPPQVVTAHAMAAMRTAPAERMARVLAAQGADIVLDRALRETFGDNYADLVCHPVDPPVSVRHAGLMQSMRHRARYAGQTSDIPYGTGGPANHLDIWRRPGPHAGLAPVLVHVPGGAWTVNDKRGQGYAMMRTMVELGWICVSINYRRSPHNAWPAHIVDVKRALAWVSHNIADYGGDPDFVAITGGSSGGHLGSLAALTANDPALQPGFEAADTTVRAAVPLYGVYDLTNADRMHKKMLPFLERVVLQTRLADDPALFESASPLFHVDRSAPPFFVLHGANDPVIPATQAQAFRAALHEAGAETVCYAELPNAHHAFDAVATIRSQLVADAAAAFLGIAYGRHLCTDRGATASATILTT